MKKRSVNAKPRKAPKAGKASEAKPFDPTSYRLPEGKILVLRTCNADGTSHGNFKWPASGPVSCPDWSPEPKCGNGLHGFARGEGNGELANWGEAALWQVVEVDETSIVKIDSEKVKFPSGHVIYTGLRAIATAMLVASHPGHAVIGAIVQAPDRGTATAGYAGTATAGDSGTATAGCAGTATAGYHGTLVIRWHDGSRYRLVVGYVGENGIEANTRYRVESGKLVKVTP